MEKDHQLSKLDIDNYLCIMLLSLSAANHQKNPYFLRMFRDSGRYPTFFPDSDDPLGDARLLNDFPDLKRASNDGPVEHSLINVFKILRPVVVLDEAHRAYGKNQDRAREFAKSVNRVDPRLVIELSATPNRGISNLLVDIGGTELHNEEMIKLPVQVASDNYPEWQHTLEFAQQELERLEAEARAYQESGGRYIRPIAVVRVERTGNKQRDGVHIHSQDVRDHLLKLAVPQDAIRVKTSTDDQLRGVDLLSELSPVRWIITKSALMEGWDCPFAYVLVMLDNTQAQRAITQLVGRVMRQPYASRTGREALDQCYVYCHRTDVGIAVAQVKNGLENEGLTGLGDQVFGKGDPPQRLLINRAEPFRDKSIFLPMVLHRDRDSYIELEWQRHIKPEIDWAAIDIPPGIQASQPDPASIHRATVGIGGLADYHGRELLDIDKPVNITWFTRRLSQVISHPWQAARLVQRLADELRANGKTDKEINDGSFNLLTQLREHIKAEVDKQSKQVFMQKLQQGDITFDLKAGRPRYEMQWSFPAMASVDEPTL